MAGKISLLVDGWKSVHRKSFHGIIGFWIDSEWHLKEKVLDMDILRGSYTGKALAASVFKVLEDLQITSKILGVTCDNASNNDTMAAELSLLLQGNVSFRTWIASRLCRECVLKLIINWLCNLFVGT